MTKFRLKLTMLFVLLIGSSVLAAGLLMGNSYQKNHQAALRDHMIRELHVLNAAVPWPDKLNEAEASEYLQQQAQRFKEIAEMRITYIRLDGTVIGDSDHDPLTMNRHLDREEVREALASGTGSSVRYSDTLKERMMYVAIKVSGTEGESDSGIVRLAMSLGDIERSLDRMWLALISALLLLFIVAGAVSYRVALGVTRPLERMTSAAKRMADMDYATRVPDGGKDEVGELAKALNAMAASLQHQLDEIRSNGDRLQSVLDNMTSGVVMIAPDGKITLYNREAEQLLGSSVRERVGRSVTEIRQHFELINLIREVLEQPAYVREELTVYYPEERLLEIHIVPMTMGGD